MWNIEALPNNKQRKKPQNAIAMFYWVIEIVSNLIKFEITYFPYVSWYDLAMTNYLSFHKVYKKSRG